MEIQVSVNLRIPCIVLDVGKIWRDSLNATCELAREKPAKRVQLVHKAPSRGYNHPRICVRRHGQFEFMDAILIEPGLRRRFAPQNSVEVQENLQAINRPAFMWQPRFTTPFRTTNRVSTIRLRFDHEQNP